MVLSVLLRLSQISLPAILAALVSLPAVIFFGIGLLGMVRMRLFAAGRDSADVRSDRIEQLTNTAAQYFVKKSRFPDLEIGIFVS